MITSNNSICCSISVVHHHRELLLRSSKFPLLFFNVTNRSNYKSNMSTVILDIESETELVKDLRKRYILPHTRDEIERMQNQHEWVKGCAKGLLKAPLDQHKRGLRVLDSATADGKLYAQRYRRYVLIRYRLLDDGPCRYIAKGCGICWFRYCVSTFLLIPSPLFLSEQSSRLD